MSIGENILQEINRKIERTKTENAKLTAQCLETVGQIETTKYKHQVIREQNSLKKRELQSRIEAIIKKNKERSKKGIEEIQNLKIKFENEVACVTSVTAGIVQMFLTSQSLKNKDAAASYSASTSHSVSHSGSDDSDSDNDK